MILPLVAVAYVYTLPESPRCVGASALFDVNCKSWNTDHTVRWLLSNARQGKTQNFEGAFSALCKLRHTRLQAARDLFLMDHLLDNEEHIKQNQ